MDAMFVRSDRVEFQSFELNRGIETIRVYDYHRRARVSTIGSSRNPFAGRRNNRRRRYVFIYDSVAGRENGGPVAAISTQTLR